MMRQSISEGLKSISNKYTEIRHLKGMTQDVISDVLSKYESIKSFTDKVLKVKKNDKWWLIDKKTWEVILEPMYNYIWPAKYTKSWSWFSKYEKQHMKKAAKVQKNGMRWFIWEDWTMLTDTKYAEVRNFHNDVVAVKVPEDKGLYKDAQRTFFNCDKRYSYASYWFFKKVWDFHWEYADVVNRKWEYDFISKAGYLHSEQERKYWRRFD